MVGRATRRCELALGLPADFLCLPGPSASLALRPEAARRLDGPPPPGEDELGAVKLLAEAPDALTPNGDTSAWSCLGSVLFALLKRLAGAALSGDATIDRSDDVPDELLAGYDATFSKLHFGTQKSDDAFAEIPDTQTFAMTHLTQLVATKPHFQPLLAALQQPR